MGLFDQELILTPGTRANQPAAASTPKGALYCVTDEDNIVERNNGTSWDPFSPTGGSGGAGDFEMIERNSWAWQLGYTSGGSLEVSAAGQGVPSVSATTTSRVVQTNLFLDVATAASATSAASISSPNNSLLERGLDIDAQFIIRSPSTLTSVRAWIGFFSTFVGIDADTAPGHAAAFRFSSVAGDTGWRGVVRDGATQQVTSNIGTVVAATQYRLRIRMVMAGTPTIYFSVNGGAESSLTANLPTSTQALGTTVRVIAQAASIRNISLCRALVKYGSAV